MYCKSREVLECYQLAGDIDYILKVIVQRQSDLQRLVMQELMPLPDVINVKTLLTFGEVKQTTDIPLDE